MVAVLLVDDDFDMRMVVGVLLGMANSGLTVVGEAADVAEALQMWRGLNGPPEVIILDNHMPGMTSLEVAAQILEERPSQLIVRFSSFFDHDTRTRAAELGITHCLPKRDIDRLPAFIGLLTSS